MPKTSKIAKLPPALRRELDRRLHAASFGDLAQLSSWLQASGYAISKTSIGVYSVDNRARIEAMFDGTSPTRLVEQDLRMRALEVASTVASTESELIEVADRCLQWSRVADAIGVADPVSRDEAGTDSGTGSAAQD